jgi:hypothetical protein
MAYILVDPSGRELDLGSPFRLWRLMGEMWEQTRGVLDDRHRLWSLAFLDEEPTPEAVWAEMHSGLQTLLASGRLSGEPLELAQQVDRFMRRRRKRV